jgi:ribosomal protein S18 acetylase RimI-like enzyme
MGREDEAFVHALSEGVFAAYALRPDRAVAELVASRSALTEVGLVGARRAGFIVVSFAETRRPIGAAGRAVVAHLDAIAVTPELAGRGVGRRLLARALALAAERGAACMWLMTAQANARARRLFVAAGFLAAAWVVGAYAGREAAVLMMRPIDPP